MKLCLLALFSCVVLLQNAPPAATDDSEIESCILDLSAKRLSTKVKAIQRLGELNARQAVPNLRMIAAEKNRNLADRAAKSLEMIGPPTADEEEWFLMQHRVVVHDGRVFELPEVDFSNTRSEPKNPKFIARNALERNPDRLPEVLIGQYGVAGSAEVVQVIDANTMIVHEIDVPTNTISRELVILRGFSTKGLVDGGRWNEGNGRDYRLRESIAIVGTETYQTANGSNTVFLGIPLSDARRGLTFEQFGEATKNGILDKWLKEQQP